MVLHLEDVIDVMYVVVGDKYDTAFLFDHICGHYLMWIDSLNSNKTNVSFGGKHKLPHDSEIVCAEGYLGPFLYNDHSNEQLDIGDIQ